MLKKKFSVLFFLLIFAAVGFAMPNPSFNWGGTAITPSTWYGENGTTNLLARNGAVFKNSTDVPNANYSGVSMWTVAGTSATLANTNPACSTDYTMAMWVKSNKTGVNKAIIHLGNTSDTGGYEWKYLGDNSESFTSSNVSWGTNTGTPTSDRPISHDWNLLIFRYTTSGTKKELFMANATNRSFTMIVSAVGAMGCGTNLETFFSHWNGAANYFGKIYDFRIYKGIALDDDQMRTLLLGNLTGGGAPPASGGDLTITKYAPFSGTYYTSDLKNGSNTGIYFNVSYSENQSIPLNVTVYINRTAIYTVEDYNQSEFIRLNRTNSVIGFYLTRDKTYNITIKANRSGVNVTSSYAYPTLDLFSVATQISNITDFNSSMNYSAVVTLNSTARCGLLQPGSGSCNTSNACVTDAYGSFCLISCNDVLYLNRSFAGDTLILLTKPSSETEAYIMPGTTYSIALTQAGVHSIAAYTANYSAYEIWFNTMGGSLNAYTGHLGYLREPGTVITEFDLTCDNETYTYFNVSSRPASETQNRYNYYLILTNVSDSVYIQTATSLGQVQHDLYNPYVLMYNLNVTYGFSGVSDDGNISIFVNDSISPVQYCNITLNDIELKNVIFRDNRSTFDINVTDLYTNVSVTCKDLVNHTVTVSEDFRTFLKKFYLINEQTGLTFTYFNNYSTLKMVREDTNESFNFLTDNSTSVYFLLNGTGSEILRFEKKFTNSDNTVYSDFKLSLLTNQTRICVPEEQTLYEMVLYSSSERDVVTKAVYANCYNMAGETRYAYGDAYAARAYVTQVLYYIYIFNSAGTKILLATLDGAEAQAISLDQLEFSQRQYDFSTLTDEVSISRESNTTLLIYYHNQRNDNERIDIVIMNGSNILLNHSEVDTPNNITITFDHSSMDIPENLLTLKIYKYDEDGDITLLVRLFDKNGNIGYIDPNIIIIIVVLLMFFGFTFVAYTHVFNFFGLIICLIALALTTWTTATTEIRFLQAIIVIIGIFIFLIFKGENVSIT